MCSVEYLFRRHPRTTVRLTCGIFFLTSFSTPNVIRGRESIQFGPSLESILPQFIGDIDQIPPRYCAVKIDGRRASDWAERGKDFEMKPRRIHIESLKIVGEGGVTAGCSGKCFATFDLECVCSKGTYIRSLGRDLARALGTYGCVSRLKIWCLWIKF